MSDIKKLSESISTILKSGGQVEFGSNAIISNGNFSKVIRIDFTKAGKETEFPFNHDGIAKVLQAIGWTND